MRGDAGTGDPSGSQENIRKATQFVVWLPANDPLGAVARRVAQTVELPEVVAWAGSHAPAVLDVLVTQDARSPDSLSGVAVVPPDQALTKWQLAEDGRA